MAQSKTFQLKMTPNKAGNQLRASTSLAGGAVGAADNSTDYVPIAHRQSTAAIDDLLNEEWIESKEKIVKEFNMPSNRFVKAIGQTPSFVKPELPLATQAARKIPRHEQRKQEEIDRYK